MTDPPGQADVAGVAIGALQGKLTLIRIPALRKLGPP
jgi:hypothetical protein